MKKYPLVFSILFALLVALTPLTPTQAVEFNPNYLLSDEEMTNVFDMTLEEVQLFLERGALAEYSTTDLDGVERSAAEIIWNAAREFAISPRFLLVLLQREQSLIMDPDPSQKQLDWALGYAVCDDCSMDDPRIQKFKGFPNQVHYAAKRIRESYLADVEENGATLTGVGPGIPVQIDGVTVIPANAATSALYTYTPHLHGNKNFVLIWNKWFTQQYPTGSLLQNKETGAVWYIQYGVRRPITSRTALISRFDPNRIIQVSPTVIEAYPQGTPISFPNYSLLRTLDGTTYLLVDDILRKIASDEVFRAIGFVEDDVIEVGPTELAVYTQGEPITSATNKPQGELVQDTTTGGVYYVVDEMKSPIVSREVLKATFPNWVIRPAEEGELAALPTTSPAQLPDGTLIAVDGFPEVFVLAEGKRRHIMDEETFLTYGWKWTQILWVDARTRDLHALGEDISLGKESEPPVETASITDEE